MIKSIVNYSLDNRMLVLVFWLFIILYGLKSLQDLPIDAVPDVTNVQVQILTNSKGLAPEEVEKWITFPVETVMSGLPKVEEIRSTSKFALSVVSIVFEEGTDIYWARQIVSERLSAAREEIPEGYGQPEIGPISSGLGEIYQFEVKGEPMCEKEDLPTCFTSMELRTILDWQINYQLRSLEGIVEVNSFGGELKTYQVTIQPEALVSYGLSVADISKALQKNNRNVGGGYVSEQNEQYLIRGESLLSSLEQIELVKITSNQDGTPVYIKDVAKVEFAPMFRQGAVTRDGKGEAVIGIVMMLMGANSREVVVRVEEKIQKIAKFLPKGVRIDTFYDRSDLIERTIKTVFKNLLEGGILVVLVLLLLLGNLRGGMIVASAIPLSMLVAFIGMNFMGLSGNLMSLGAIDFGLIVDGSVVMVEAIVHLLYLQKDVKEVTHLEKVREAALKVARPVVYAVIIIILVYMPILGLSGVEAKMFSPMALTVMFALLGSLLVSLTLMPVLASLFLKKVSAKEPWLFRTLKKRYQPILELSLRQRGRTVVLASFIFAASLITIPFLGAEFIPKLDEGAIAMQIWRLPSISLEQSLKISGIAEKVLLEEFSEIKTVVSKTGRAEIATDPMGVEISDVYIMLNSPETWRYKSKAELLKAIERTMKEHVPAAIFSYSQPIELRVAELISGVRSDLAIHLYGDDLQLLKENADKIVALIQKVPGAQGVKAEQTAGLPMMRIKLQQEKIARYGLDADDVLEVIESIGGQVVGAIFEGQKRFALQLRYDQSITHNLSAINNLKVKLKNNNGEDSYLPLSAVAQIVIEDGPAQISRDRISRRINVEANVRGRDLASFVAESKNVLAEKLKLPDGYSLEWGGQFENLESATKSLQILVPLTLLLILLLLYMIFNSASLALLIFLNVPLAFSGGLLALTLRGYPFSISAGVGFIALFGIAVLNGVVLVSQIVENRESGFGLIKAAKNAAETRLRPVLMTALVASLGFIPMAIATSAGAEVQRPLATVVIGGLISSTLLTLLVLPAVYSLQQKFRIFL